MRLPDMQFFLDHFPDGVDIQIVMDKHVLEIVQDTPPDWAGRLGDVDMNAPDLRKHVLEMTEVEPETGIWAVMSPVTHRIYVFADPEVLLHND